MSEDLTMEGETKVDKVFSQMERLKLEEEVRVVEIEDDDIDDTNKDFKSSIACKIHMGRVINSKVFTVIMPRIWGIEVAVKVEKFGTNVYRCKFKRIKNKDRVTRRGPWSYNDAILVFHEPKGSTSVEALEFNYVSF